MIGENIADELKNGKTKSKMMEALKSGILEHTID